MMRSEALRFCSGGTEVGGGSLGVSGTRGQWTQASPPDCHTVAASASRRLERDQEMGFQ